MRDGNRYASSNGAGSFAGTRFGEDGATRSWAGQTGPGIRAAAFAEGTTGMAAYPAPSSGAPSPSAPSAPIPEYKLYDANAVFLAAFLGSPLAGGVLMGMNYRRLGKPNSATGAIALGIAVTGLLVLLGYLIPNGVGVGVSVVAAWGMKALAQSRQGETVNQHEVHGGKLASRWAAAGIGLGTAVVLAGVIFGVVFAQTQMTQVIVGKDEVEFSGTATKEDAQALGKALQAAGYGKDKNVSVLLNKGTDGTTSVGFVVKDGIWDNPQMVFGYEEVGREVASAIGGYPIKVQLVNSEREVKKELNVGRAALGKDEVFYFGSATESDANALAQQLKAIGFFEGSGASVLLTKNEDGTAISFIVMDGIWEQPDKVAAFERIVRGCAKTVGGLPVKLRFMTPRLELKKEEMVK